MASNDIGYLIIVFFIGHFARRAHIPRFSAFCTVAFGISGLICCLPHFLYGAHEKDTITLNSSLPIKDTAIQLCSPSNDTSMDFCNVNKLSSLGDDQIRKPREHSVAAVTIIAVGMVLQGMAKAPRHPFTITFIDENVEKVKTGFYLGIIISLNILGPALAFGLGSYFTRIYVTLEATDLYPKHPNWIGAWWLGYLVFGAASIVASVPLFFFPRRLKGAPPRPVEEQLHIKATDKLSDKVLAETKDFLNIILQLARNPVYVCLVIATVLQLFSIGGAQAFLPKYIESQFGLPAWKANLLMATMNMTAASVGTFLGGWLTKRAKMSPLTGLKFINIMTLIAVGLKCLGFVFGCEQPEIHNQPSLKVSAGLDITGLCHCNDEAYFPICGSDNRNYYSPCHAGCLETRGNTYSNCSEISEGGTAYAGLCDFNCPFLYPYIVTSALTAFLSTILIMPKILAKIRSVSEKEKGVAIGISSCLTSIFGWLLGPIVYGRVIDSTCLIWDTSCGQRGACALYDMAVFRNKIHGFYVVSRGLALVFLVIAMIIASKTKIYERHSTKTEFDMTVKDT